jgi:serine/threonine-protein kinase
VTTATTRTAWETIAAEAPDRDPGATVRGPAFDETHAAALPIVVTLPELPILALDEGGAAADAADFDVTGVLGEGGMGKVLLARQRSLRREVAIKVMKSENARPESVQNLLAEAVITGSIEHPSVIPVHVLGRDVGGRPVLVMKRVEGVSWQKLARDREHPLWSAIAPDAADRLDAHLEILMDVCNAAHCAHQKGFVHRDIKLDNVMIGAFGEVYLVDWGIAMRIDPKRPTQTALPGIVGTPAYMAPEMVFADADRIDARTDVYLLGAALHDVLTGAPRHAGQSLFDVLVSARDSAPFAYGPDVPAELAAICNRAMHVDPAARFATPLELRMALASFRRHRGSVALCEESAARLGEVARERDPRRVHALLTECRFGLVQARRSWPENAAAEAGLEACLASMIEHELTQRDAAGARALLAELVTPRPDLEAKIAILEAELKAAAVREEKLRHLEQQRDLSIGADVQLAMVAIMPALMILVLAYFIGIGARIATAQLIGAPLLGLVLMTTGYAFARRRVHTEIGRKALAMLILMPAGAVLHRTLATLQAAPFAAIALGDLVIGAAVIASMTIALMPRLRWVLIPILTGATAIAFRPERAFAIFGVVVITSFPLIAVMWRRSTRAPA